MFIELLLIKKNSNLSMSIKLLYNLLPHYICFNELTYVKVCFMNEAHGAKMH